VFGAVGDHQSRAGQFDLPAFGMLRGDLVGGLRKAVELMGGQQYDGLV